MTPNQSFAAVLAAARAGADWAWAAIYSDLAPPVRGYLRARGAAEPEDLLGEVFLQAVRDLASFEGGERELRAWILKIAHHRLIDDRRSRRRRPVEPAPDEVIEARAPPGDAEQEALEHLGEADIVRLIAGLSTAQRSVILLRVLGDLAVEEVARVVGKRPGAVKALQRRGLARIERQLQERGRDP